MYGSEQKIQEPVKIWSYNVFLRPPPIKNNNDDYKSERFNLIVNRIDLYDIVCFQEMFQTLSFRAEDMIAIAIRKGFHYWATSKPISFWGSTPVDSGLLVISRFPIVFSQFYSFNIGIFSDSSSDKGYLYCKIDINGEVLHLFNLHLQASFLAADKSSYRKELSLAARKQQCRLLKGEIKRILKEEYQERDLVLLIGDFNINAHTENECLAKASLMRSFIPEEYHEYEEFVALMEGKEDKDYIMDRTYRLRDLVFERYGYHPTTYGEQAVMVLTHKQEYGIPQCLDYMFQIEAMDSKGRLVPNVASCMVEKAKVEGHPFTQLSDHYGLSMRLQYH